MSIRIEKDKCVGCGRCTEVCPNIFKLGEDGKAEVLEPEKINCLSANSDECKCAMRASDECPVEAIFVEE